MARQKKMANGLYHKQVFIETIDGKNRYKSVYGKTLKEVNEKAAEIKIKLHKGIDAYSDDTFEKWKNRFLRIKKSEVGNSQYHNYLSYCNHLSSLDRVPLSKIAVVDLQEIINDLSVWHNGIKPLSKKSLHEIQSTASQIFRTAIESRVTDYNPAEYVKIPKIAAEHHREALTEEQRKWVIGFPHRAQRAAMIMLFSGLRRGELTALTWKDIDLSKNTIAVNKSVEMIKGQPRLKSTKTASGIRTVSIPNVLSEYLKLEKQREKPLNLLVVHKADGGMMTNQSWKSLWESYMQDLNVEYGYKGKANKFSANKKRLDGSKQGKLPMIIDTFTMHQLRHTFCTLMYDAGVDVLTAKNQMGHSDIKTTLGIYTHLDKSHHTEQISKLDAYLGNIQLQYS